jgi:hypothetical protein
LAQPIGDIYTWKISCKKSSSLIWTFIDLFQQENESNKTVEVHTAVKGHQCLILVLGYTGRYKSTAIKVYCVIPGLN